MKKANEDLILRQVRLDIRKRKKFKKFKQKTISHRSTKSIIEFPEYISIVNQKYRSLLIAALRNIHIKDARNEPIILDFRNVKVLYPDGAIYLIHKLDTIQNKELVKGRSSYTLTVKAMLSKLGIHKLMKIKEYKATNQNPMVERWHFIEGVNAVLGDKYDEIEQQVDKIVKDKKSKMILHNAISEAITNVINHAYDKTDTYKKWLLFFALVPKDDCCFIVLSDLGKTIPATIPVTWKEKAMNISDLVLSKKDSQLIELATKMHKSSTGLNYRGKGFTDIMEVEQKLNGSKVMVASRKGAWSSEDGHNDYIEAISGTTVGWSLPLNLDLVSQNREV